MPVVKLHRTVGVRVGSVQVGGGAPVVVQSMTMTDTADAAGTARQCIELAEAGSEMVRVTVNLPDAAAAVPEIKRRMLDAGVTAPLIGDFHYNGHLLLTRYPDCAHALDKYPYQPGNVGTGKRRDEQFSTICKVARDHGKPVRIGVNGGSLNQELVLSRMQENTDRDLGPHFGRDHQRVHGAVGGPVHRAGAGVRAAQGPDHHLVQDVAAARPDCGLPRRCPQNRSAAAPRAHGSRDGDEGAGVVRLGHGRPAQRGHWRHDPRVADTAPGRRSPRRGLRRVRAAAGARAAVVRAERHRVPGLRAHHQQHVPGAGRAHAGLHPRAHAGVENAATRASRR